MGSAVLAFDFVVQRLSRGDGRRVVTPGDVPQPDGGTPALTDFLDRKGGPRAGWAAAGGVAVIVARAASADVVAPHEAGLDAVEERLEVEEARGDDAEALYRLGADRDDPGVGIGSPGVSVLVPEHELANRGGDGAARMWAAPQSAVPVDLQCSKREEWNYQCFFGFGYLDFPDDDRWEHY